jgi:hypothetical protein
MNPPFQRWSMQSSRFGLNEVFTAANPSRRTLHAELLRLCARIGYSPHVSA